MPSQQQRQQHQQKRKPSKRNTSTSAATTQLPLDLQQLILNQFQQAFPFSSPTALQTTIQTVKGHLYNRHFHLAFSQPAYREAYALRWSASRALAYAHIFHNDLSAFLHWGTDSISTANRQLSRPEAENRSVCIGGGAGAEIAALASLCTPPLKAVKVKVTATAIDVADWSDVLLALQAVISSPSPSSPSAAAIATSNPWQSNFLHRNVLDLSENELNQLLVPAGTTTTLCTIMFTLNELFASSVAKTTALLLKITHLMPDGSHLLVVDSPGSYSELTLGGGAKKEDDSGSTASTASTSSNSNTSTAKPKRYPMQWLLDHVLLDGSDNWVKVISDDSRWFRLSPDLKYPLDLENMRYQIHLYRRVRKQTDTQIDK